MRSFFSILLLILGFMALIGGAPVGLLFMIGGGILLATGRNTSKSQPASVRTTQSGGAVDTAVLQAAVETLAKQQNLIEDSEALLRANKRIRQLEDEVRSLRRHLDEVNATQPVAQAERAPSGPSSAMTTEPSHAAVDALARLLDRS